MRQRFVLVPVLICCASAAAAQQLDRRALDSIMDARPELFDTLSAGDTSSPRFDADVTHWGLPAVPISDRGAVAGLADRPFQLSYDRADGFRIGAIVSLPSFLATSNRLRGMLFAGYAFASHYWQASGEISLDVFAPASPLRIGAEGHVITDTRDSWKMGSLENTVFAAMAGLDVRDQFRRRGGSFQLRQFFEPRTWLAAEARYDRYRSSSLEAHWSLFGRSEPFVEVPAIADGRMRSIALQAGSDYATLRPFSRPRFLVDVEWEMGRWSREREDTVRSFTAFVVDATGSLGVIPRMLWLAANARFGAALADAPPQRLFSLGGPGSLPAYPINSLRGSRMLLLSVHAMLQPLRSGALRSLRVIVEDAVGAAASPSLTSRDPFDGLPGQLRDYSNSLAIYLGTATGAIRVGLAWRTDRGDAPSVVVRLAAR